MKRLVLFIGIMFIINGCITEEQRKAQQEAILKKALNACLAIGYKEDSKELSDCMLTALDMMQRQQEEARARRANALMILGAGLKNTSQSYGNSFNNRIQANCNSINTGYYVNTSCY